MSIKLANTIAKIVLAVIASALCYAQQTGPFGFQWHSSKQDVIAKLGKNKIVADTQDGIALSTAPSPHSDFDEYILIFAPSDGLVKISASTRTIQAAPDGQEVRAEFNSIVDALKATYGDPNKKYDFVRSGSLFEEDKYFMVALSRGERTLMAYWKSQNMPNHITGIMLKVEGKDSRHAQIDLQYEMEGFKEYADSEKKKADSVF